MSKLARVVELTNELTDVVAKITQEHAPIRDWKTEEWNTLLDKIHDEEVMFWEFQPNDDPVMVLQEVYTGLKNIFERLVSVDKQLNQREDLEEKIEEVRHPRHAAAVQQGWDEAIAWTIMQDGPAEAL